MYPENDNDWTEATIGEVDGNDFEHDGWWLSLPSDSPIVPKPGMTARIYPKDNIGRPVRGLFIAGTKIWYRTEDEQKQHGFAQLYGKDAKDILQRWDDGESVFSFSMGGLGPSYEQALQVTAFEVLRELIDGEIDHASLTENAVLVADATWEKVKDRPICCGVSGAQWGAAWQLGAKLYFHGPKAFENADQDRTIQVSKNFPSPKITELEAENKRLRKLLIDSEELELIGDMADFASNEYSRGAEGEEFCLARDSVMEKLDSQVTALSPSNKE